eukprot:jgi/Hompol1/1468/HPOL_000344-RA
MSTNMNGGDAPQGGMVRATEADELMAELLDLTSLEGPVDNLDVATLLRNLDSAGQALDSLSSKTDGLLSRLDAILSQASLSNGSIAQLAADAAISAASAVDVLGQNQQSSTDTSSTSHDPAKTDGSSPA